MKISTLWLKDYVKIRGSEEALADRLTMAGLEVERIEKASKGLVFETEVTSNRPDWLSYLGVAREVAALYGTPSAAPKNKAPKKTSRSALNASDLQAVERDFAFVVDVETPAADVIAAAKNVDKKLIDRISLFDVYEGKGMEDGKKSLAICVRLQPLSETLTDKEIEAISDKVVDAVAKATGGTLRG